MDRTSLIDKYKCPKCGELPKNPYAAEDGKFYHEPCILELIESAGSGNIISPATNKPMGNKVIHAKTIQCLIEKIISNEGVDQNHVGQHSEDTTAEKIRKTKESARDGSAKHMALLGRWHVFGEQEGMECDEIEGYRWCERAAEKGNVSGMAYQGMCLLHGYGIEKDRYEGFELLVDAANEGSAFAAYKLGSFYYAGVHGFKEDRKKAQKWLSRANSKLSELEPSERGNVHKYLSSLLGTSLSACICPLDSVPKQIPQDAPVEHIIVDSTCSVSSIGMTSANANNISKPHPTNDG
mmetsp:Transcript_38161/g.80304  ORF Transcript_38161/g.80304 Transcript_38161/m.80304 type:complete len:295 (+) Transcript_38161:61-945(+)